MNDNSVKIQQTGHSTGHQVENENSNNSQYIGRNVTATATELPHPLHLEPRQKVILDGFFTNTSKPVSTPKTVLVGQQTDGSQSKSFEDHSAEEHLLNDTCLVDSDKEDLLSGSDDTLEDRLLKNQTDVPKEKVAQNKSNTNDSSKTPIKNENKPEVKTVVVSSDPNNTSVLKSVGSFALAATSDIFVGNYIQITNGIKDSITEKATNITKFITCKNNWEAACDSLNEKEYKIKVIDGQVIHAESNAPLTKRVGNFLTNLAPIPFKIATEAALVTGIVVGAGCEEAAVSGVGLCTSYPEVAAHGIYSAVTGGASSAIQTGLNMASYVAPYVGSVATQVATGIIKNPVLVAGGAIIGNSLIGAKRNIKTIRKSENLFEKGVEAVCCLGNLTIAGLTGLWLINRG